MDANYMLKGFIIGFSIAAPIGPIGVLCIRRTLAEGLMFGLLTGLGAATADAIYGGIAGFGLTFISGFLTGRQIWLRLAGGTFLCYLGIKIFLTKPAVDVAHSKQHTLIGAYTSTFFVTLANPVTILCYSAVFAGLGISTGGSYISAGLLVLGVFMGSTAWWLILSSGVSMLREKLTHNAMRWVNRISGLIIIGFGLAALL